MSEEQTKKDGNKLVNRYAANGSAFVPVVNDDPMYVHKLPDDPKAAEKLIDEMAKPRSLAMYEENKLKQRYDNIKSIQAEGGYVLIVVDEYNSRKKTFEQVQRAVGPEATTEEVLAEVEKRVCETQLLSPFKAFEIAIAINQMQMKHPHLFGKTETNRTETDEILEALQDAAEQAIQTRAKMISEQPALRVSFAIDKELYTADPKAISKRLGKGWANRARKKGDRRRIIVTTKG